jgi:hypothetical protein
VVDASLTLSWCFEDEMTPFSRSVLVALQTTFAVVPALCIQIERRDALWLWQTVLPLARERPLSAYYAVNLSGRICENLGFVLKSRVSERGKLFSLVGAVGMIASSFRV